MSKTKQRELIHNYGPNAACVYRIPGPRGRTVIGAKYDVDLVVDRDWKTVQTFNDSHDAMVFAWGASVALTEAD